MADHRAVRGPDSTVLPVSRWRCWSKRPNEAWEERGFVTASTEELALAKIKAMCHVPMFAGAQFRVEHKALKRLQRDVA